MGSIGDCYDNAVIESFWSRMQVELLDRKRWKTKAELANAIFEYLAVAVITWIEKAYNRRHRQRALDKLTPLEFETVLHPVAVAA